MIMETKKAMLNEPYQNDWCEMCAHMQKLNGWFCTIGDCWCNEISKCTRFEKIDTD